LLIEIRDTLATNEWGVCKGERRKSKFEYPSGTILS